MTSEMGVIALGAMAAGFVQGLSGFGFGMVAMSIWVWSLDPHLAAVLTVAGSLAGQVLAALTLPRRWNWAMLLPLLGGAALGVPLGCACCRCWTCTGSSWPSGPSCWSPAR